MSVQMELTHALRRIRRRLVGTPKGFSRASLGGKDGKIRAYRWTSPPPDEPRPVMSFWSAGHSFLFEYTSDADVGGL